MVEGTIQWGSSIGVIWESPTPSASSVFCDRLRGPLPIELAMILLLVAVAAGSLVGPVANLSAVTTHSAPNRPISATKATKLWPIGSAPLGSISSINQI